MNDLPKPTLPTPGHSPLPRTHRVEKTDECDFKRVVDLMLEGKKVARKEWKNDYFCYLDQKSETLYIRTDKLHTWIINKGDLEGKDWFVVG